MAWRDQRETNNNGESCRINQYQRFFSWLSESKPWHGQKPKEAKIAEP